MATPLITMMELGYFLIILLFVYGIAHIVRAVSGKDYGLEFIYGILSVILGFLIIVVPGLKTMTSGMLLYIMAGWFVVQGILSIYRAVKMKKDNGGAGWIWGICAGVLCILMGLYSAVHPMVLALTLGLMVGFYFIVSGVDMIAMSSRYKEAE